MTTLSPSGKRALDNYIEEIINAKNVPGFVLGISNIDEEIYFNGGGSKVVHDPTSGQVNEESIFWVCSQTKLIAALAVLKLIEQGKLNMETPVGDYLPEFRNPIIVERTSTQKTAFRPAKTVLTVKHVLNFSSGLFYPVTRENVSGLSDGYTSREMHASSDPVPHFFRIVTGGFPGLPLKFEPGTDFVYGWSSDVLGFIAEKVSGQTLEQYCKENIFAPVGMEASFYLTPDLRERLVDLAFREENGKLSAWADQVSIIERDPSKLHVHLGGVGLYSSMRGYLRLLRHLMQINAGKTVPNAILKRETVKQMFIPALTEAGSKSLSEFTTVPGTQWGTALAIVTQDWPKRRKKGSVFWGGWAGTSYFIDPSSGIAVVFGVQITPSHDVAVTNVWLKLEALVYSALANGTERL